MINETLKTCDDCISRQAAINAIWDGTNMDIYTKEVKECLEALPPVTPAEKDNDMKIFFQMLYEDLLLFNLDKQTLSFDCGKYDLMCNITFELQSKEVERCKP